MKKVKQKLIKVIICIFIICSVMQLAPLSVKSDESETRLEIVQGDSITIYKGFLGNKLTAKLMPQDEIVTAFYSSSDEKVLKMQRGGIIDAIGLGTATVEAVSADGKLKDTITITVKEFEPAKGDYTFVVLPDTQYYSATHGLTFDMVTKWIKNNAEKENIKFVMQVGDITDDNSETQWGRARQYLRTLDGVVPYALALGNHDYQGVSTTRDTLINNYFSVEDFKKSPTYGGVFEKDKMNNVYHRFKVGNINYLVIALEFGPRDEVLEWANGVAAKYPDDRVIVITHAYMNHDGNRIGKTTEYTPYVYPLAKIEGETVNDGEDIWEKLVRKHKNMFMVFSGHIPYEDVVSRVDTGDNGNKVLQVLADPQWYGNGGEGLILLVKFNEGGEQVSFNWYSPTLDKYFKDYNQFTVDLVTKEKEEPVPYTGNNGEYDAPAAAISKPNNMLIVYIIVGVVLVLVVVGFICLKKIKKNKTGDGSVS